MKLRYEGFDSSGKPVQGSIDAPDTRDAGERLRRQGIFVTSVSVEQAKSATHTARGRRTRAKAPRRLQNVSMFTRQLSMLCSAGTPITQALAALERQTKDASWREAIGAIRGRVEEGASLAQAMESRPAHFDNVTRSLIGAGEAGGQLPAMLQRLAALSRQQLHVRHTVLGALTYPSVLLVIAVNVIVLMLIFVLPRFADMFDSLDAPLPPTTAMLMAASEFIRSQWPWVVGGIVAATIGVIAFLKSSAGKTAIDTAIIRAPRVGVITRNVLTARMIRLMGVLVEARIPLVEAIDLCRAAAGNIHFENLLMRASDAVTKGESMSESLAEGDLLPPNLCEAVRNGEASGQIGPVMLGMAEFMDEDNEVTLRALSSIIEPVILVVLGAVVGFVALSMFLPLFDLTAMTQPGGPK
ncbi:MAG: type II secretion system F family protein [Phycisphaeraceae bacterium]|nr:type II secretion system F family protein [Phycisphaeraceae bacterium]